MKCRKRLLVLTSTFPRWKDDTDPPFVYELCLRLKKHYDIHVLAPHYPGSAIEEKLAGLQVTRFRYFFEPWERLAYQGGISDNLKQNPWLYGQVPLFFLAEFFALIRLLNRQRLDLIHAHWLIPQGLIPLLARLFLKSVPPLLCTSHGSDLFGLQDKLMNRIKRIVILKSDALTVVSRSMRKEVTRLGANHESVHVIPMGTDLKNRFVPPETRQNKGSLLFVGRLVEKKGLRYLIDALPLILKKHPQTSLRIAGDGPEKGTLQSQSKRLGISDHVRFLGAVKNESLPALYQESNVVVFPSVDREGFGLVLVEALGCECATVVTDLPAMKDIIIDGKTGFVVPQKNVQKLAEKIVSLLDDPEMSRSVGKEGRRFVVERYDWDEIARQYAALIESITR
ncbi:MAG: glycosyltransferase [Deltaproteobacteria bacterium]|jgi:glycosyltransferase involved in cell wall biosynthesis|nr:glycosyltransferase [Deltaproteobacteria bacterium]